LRPWRRIVGSAACRCPAVRFALGYSCGARPLGPARPTVSACRQPVSKLTIRQWAARGRGRSRRAPRGRWERGLWGIAPLFMNPQTPMPSHCGQYFGCNPRLSPLQVQHHSQRQRDAQAPMPSSGLGTPDHDDWASTLRLASPNRYQTLHTQRRAHPPKMRLYYLFSAAAGMGHNPAVWRGLGVAVHEGEPHEHAGAGPLSRPRCRRARQRRRWRHCGPSYRECRPKMRNMAPPMNWGGDAVCWAGRGVSEGIPLRAHSRRTLAPPGAKRSAELSSHGHASSPTGTSAWPFGDGPQRLPPP
jgi:hypothetical protein